MTAASRVRSPTESDSVQHSPSGQKAPEAFRTIGEAADELDLKPHVLRFWETRFADLKPMKRADGRRYYRPEDMALLRTLKHLLHDQGLTIRGALKALRDAKGEAGASVLEGEDVDSSRESADALDASPVAGPSVRELQDTVRTAVERGDFRRGAESGVPETRERLEALLSDLCDLKSRLDAVRTSR